MNCNKIRAMNIFNRVKFETDCRRELLQMNFMVAPLLLNVLHIYCTSLESHLHITYFYTFIVLTFTYHADVNDNKLVIHSSGGLSLYAHYKKVYLFTIRSSQPICILKEYKYK